MLAFGTVVMAQTTQKSEADKKEMMSKPQKKNMKKVDATVIERTESAAPAETPAENKERTPVVDESKNKKQESAPKPAPDNKKAVKANAADKRAQGDD